MTKKETDLEHNSTMDFEERFTKRYPDGKIEIVKPGLVPAKAQELFEWRSSQLVSPESHQKGDFYGYMKVTHSDSSSSWLAWRKPFLHNTNQWTFGIETCIYCQDLDIEGQPIGWGEIAYWLTNRDMFFHDKPFLVSSNTEEPFHAQGYDLRRVVMLNAICELIFNLPLYSSDHFLPQKKTGVRAHQKTWERLVEEGVARHLQDKGKDRYVFEQGGQVRELLPGVLERIGARRKNK